MKRSIYILTAVFALVSCSKYQYVAMKSQDTLKHKNFWFHEDDKVRIEYSFHGPNIPMSMRFTNKTGQPMFVDWRNSHLILNPTQVNPGADGVNIYSSGSAVESNKIPMTEFMKSYLVNKIEPYQSVYFDKMYQFRRAPIDLSNHQDKVRVRDSRGDHSKRANLYNNSNSPLHFTKEITLHFGEVDKNTTSLTHTFYLHQAFNAGPNFSWIDAESITWVRDHGNVVALLLTFGLGALLIAVVANSDVSGEYYWDDEDDGW